MHTEAEEDEARAAEAAEETEKYNEWWNSLSEDERNAQHLLAMLTR